MSKYAQGEATIKEVRNSDFLSSISTEPAKSTEPVEKSKKKSKKKQVAVDATWAAIVTGAFGLLMIVIEKGRRENTRDHGFVQEKLDSLKEDIKDIDEDVSHIEEKLDTHINDHLNSFNKKK